MLWKKLVAVALVLGMLPFSLALADDDGYKTPEDAVKAFAKALAKNDLDDALDTFCIEEQARSYDMGGWLQKTQAYDAIHMTQPAPNSNEMFRDINESVLEGFVARQIFLLCGGFFADKLFLEQPVAGDAKQWASNLALRIDPARLRDLKVDSIEVPQDAGDFPARAALIGAEEATQRTVVFALGDTRREVNLWLARYGKRWYIAEITEVGGEMDSAVEPVPTYVVFDPVVTPAP